MSRTKPLSLYPLKFDQVMIDVLKMKPEPKEQESRLNTPPDGKDEDAALPQEVALS